MRLVKLLDEEKEKEIEKQEKMEKKLYEAALTGSVSSLQELLQEDPLILDRTIVACISETPLHVSAMLGHIEFTKEILSRKPELVHELDSKGSSPLHLASAKGYVEIVKELVLMGSDVCLERNQEGRTPLHLAVIKDRIKIVNELTRVKPEATRVPTDSGETVLHLCVKHNRLEAMKILVDLMGRDDELINFKDHDGNTVLHLAVAKKQIETIKFLLTSTGVQVNALNSNNFTAMDVLTQSPRDLKDMDIRETLQAAGALRAKETPSPLVERDWISTQVLHDAEDSTPALQKKTSNTKRAQVNIIKPKHKNKDWLGRKKNALMVVASLIATVAFQAGLAPPGGVWQDELSSVDANGNPVDKPHHVGMSVMAYEHKDAYGQFMIFNTTSFLASLSIILLLVSGLPLKRRRWMWVQMVIMWIAISTLALTYFVALSNLTPDIVQKTLFQVTRISFIVWLGLIAVLFMGHFIRVSLWSFRKFKKVDDRERVLGIVVEE